MTPSEMFKYSLERPVDITGLRNIVRLPFALRIHGQLKVKKRGKVMIATVRGIMQEKDGTYKHYLVLGI